jgi:hypothetical protein
MLGACGDHGFVEDEDSGISCKDLAFLLFPSVYGKGEARVDAGTEVSHVVIQIRLADLGVDGEDVQDEGAEIDGIETFGGVVKNGIVDVINCCCKLVVCDGEDHLVGVPSLVCSGVGGMQFLALGCCGAGWDDWVGWRFNLWDVECLPVASQVDGWILKKAKMSLAVPPQTGNSHEVSGQFVDDQLDFFMGGFAKDTCEDGMRHLCLNALGRNGIRCHPLGGMGSSAKERHLVGSDDNADDANEKSTGSSVPDMGMCGNVGDGYAADDSNGSLNGWFGCKFKADFH